MKEFIEKLIGRLEEQIKIEESIAKSETEGHPITHQYASNCLKLFRNQVNQLAEEYNNGWIPVSERLPELTEGTECFKQSKCCLVTLKWWDGDMTESVGWYNQSGVWSDDSNNCKVLAWQPLPEPYRPKGE